MTLARKDFAAFFAALHDGHSPFSWQERLLDEVLETGAWPDQIAAPTGAGKTAAIDVHVFAAALTAGLDRPRLPRRLAMVVGRRVLVDDQYEHAEQIAAALADPTDEITAKVAARLGRLRWPTGRPTGDNGDASPLVVARLRGATAPSREWRDHPTACAVICATPDMWGSRLLFRGYGTTRAARPREAGLLALDTAVVVDEAHLARQLLTTARRVSQLVSVAEELLPVPGLQVVETTATPAGDGVDLRSVGVVEQDLVDEPALSRRLTLPKPVRVLPVKDWPADNAAKRRRVAARLADEVVALLVEPAQGGPDAGGPATHTVGCYVNTVAMAVATATALQARHRSDGTAIQVVVVCGQTRPADLHRLRQRHPGLLDARGNDEIDVLVATQSLEVGVDLDMAAVVTELAPGSALAQRIGRVNRRGRRLSAPVCVIGPVEKLTDRSHCGPYQPDELTEAWLWVQRRGSDPAGMSPWAIRNDPPPTAQPRRMLWQRPELGDLWHWSRTSDDLAAEPQLDLWLADSFDEDNSVGLVVRDAMPIDAADATSLMQLLPPTDREVFTVPPRVARAITVEATTPADRDDVKRPLAVRIRGDELAVVDLERVDVDPGDIVVIDSGIAAFTPSASGTSSAFSPPVPVPADDDAVQALPRAVADDVLHEVDAPSVGQVALRLEPAAWPAAPVEALLATYAALSDNASERTRRDQLRQLLSQALSELACRSRGAMLRATLDLLRGRVKDSDLILHRDEAGAPTRLLVLDRRRAWADERLRQTWLPRDEPVLLDDHQAAVAVQAARFASSVGLPAPLVDALRLAGQHHDDGKIDPRFQKVLGAEDEILAKSTGRPLAASQRDGQSALPVRWRHEQRSVVASWAPVHAAMPHVYAQLAVRLVGTSHGHGRAGFPHTANELLPDGDSDTDRHLAEDLFDLGGWDTLIETTHRRWGVWGCAYLEALLRAADGNVSAEGR